MGESRYRDSIVGLVVAGIPTLLIGLGMGVVALGVAWKNRCLLYGDAPEGALISEHSIIREERSWWPIGTSCEWLRADGHGTVWGTSGYVELTVATYGMLLAGALALVTAAVLSSQRDSH